MTWKVTPRNVWNDIVSWRTKFNSTLQRINSMHWRPSFQRRSEMFILGTYWTTRYSVVIEQTCTIDHKMDQSMWQTIYLVWSLAFMHVNTNSIVMWVTLQNNAYWDWFKTPILQQILRIQNLRQVEHCAFWEAIRLFQSVGCVRNTL